MILERIDQHCPEWAAVTDEVSLTVAVKIESSNGYSSIDWLLEDPSSDCPSLDRDLFGEGDIDRQELHRLSLGSSYVPVGSTPATWRLNVSENQNTSAAKGNECGL